MEESHVTCWTMIRSASAGDLEARSEFARRYERPIKAFLAARWSRSIEDASVADAAQEVFVECFRPGGVLDRVGHDAPDEFRAFVLGVTRNVALRIERSDARHGPNQEDPPSDLLAEDPGLSTLFDRAWAEAIVAEAASLHARRAEAAGARERRRVELLARRFGGRQPIRAIAADWGEDPSRVHREYRTAREEFRAALEDVVRFNHPESQDRASRALDEVLAVFEGRTPDAARAT